MTYKVLGQANPVANTDTSLYTVGATKQGIVSTLTICNRAATGNAAVRVAVRPAGAAIAAQHYILWEHIIAPEDTSLLTIGITVEATDVITVRSTNADTAFSLFGQEV